MRLCQSRNCREPCALLFQHSAACVLAMYENYDGPKSRRLGYEGLVHWGRRGGEDVKSSQAAGTSILPGNRLGEHKAHPSAGEGSVINLIYLSAPL